MTKKTYLPCRWASENTARRIIPLRGLPRVAHGKPAANDKLANGRKPTDDGLVTDAAAVTDDDDGTAVARTFCADV
ncbi:hypothetical protein DERF_003349 [Dermatophagoides farinae]|uniref:Uncharacterized protein n=1 Tax=Dermatophagoides farinae TaxID=6954 RepID=A0A922LBE8_DERFA|nr:hypothetical protein DERF_003349 [Dermatophagoides farinae]